MKSTRVFLALFAAIVLLYVAAAANAASVDMNDPRRALGREDDVRIDAQLLDETVSSGSPISITYQIQNFTTAPVALAPKVTDATYDAETRTITIGIGSEVPRDGRMPQLIVIGPGEKKTFSVSATPMIAVAASPGSPFRTTPRYVQVKVSILRDIAPFGALIQKQQQQPQAAARTAVMLSDEQFDQWMTSNDTIFLNTIPVRYEARRAPSDVENRSASMRGGRF
jgi:hypothetical protein